MTSDAPHRIWVSAPNEDNEVETWTDPDEGGSPYILATPAALSDHPTVKQMVADAEARGMERAAEICAGIRTRIANGPMPEGARFDYEQDIRAEAATIRGETT